MNQNCSYDTDLTGAGDLVCANLWHGPELRVLWSNNNVWWRLSQHLPAQRLYLGRGDALFIPLMQQGHCNGKDRTSRRQSGRFNQRGVANVKRGSVDTRIFSDRQLVGWTAERHTAAELLHLHSFPARALWNGAQPA